MRDYSFGNFISALRVRRGLSQYQLGALVGVSDKAVSKWENGVSKPRMNTIVKLAEVLDIGTDELLACKYDTFNHKRKDLFAMDEKIISKAELKMKEMYGEQLPISISNRFKTEELMLKNQMMLRWMGFLGDLHDRFYEEDDFFLVRGAQMGSSFIAWLLGATNVNPLPAHYYCPKCKKIEFVSNMKCGLDAPDKKCSCGTAYEKDGFGIDAIHMYPLFGGCDINISDGAMELAKECFKDYFREYSEIREIKIQKSEAEEENINKGQLTNVVRYILVPREVAVQYPGEIFTLTPEEYFQKFSKFERLMIVEDPQEHRKYRLEIGIDISEERIQDKALQKYNSMEALVNEGLRIALMAATPDESIHAILEYLGKSLNGERTYIFEKNEKGGDNNTYEWVAEGVKPEKDNLQNLPPEICANWYQRFQKGKHIVFHDLEEIREIDPLQYENLKRQDIHSLVAVPLYDEGKVIAFYGVDNPPPLSLEYTSNMLQITGHFLSSCIRRRNLMRELEDMSYKDALTGFGNRFAMNRYISQIDHKKSIGVVYCDITGLKHVNDTMGHKAGDQLILRARDCLSKAFGDYGVFRIGGDEFLALCSQVEQDVLDERIRLLKKLMEENTVNMAVGMIWQDEATTELDILLRESEKRMYADKAEYYRKNGIERRRH